jgi:hypothetical protein
MKIEQGTKEDWKKAQRFSLQRPWHLDSKGNISEWGEAMSSVALLSTLIHLLLAMEDRLMLTEE